MKVAARCPQCKREGFLHATWCSVGMEPTPLAGDAVQKEGAAVPAGVLVDEQDFNAAADRLRNEYTKAGVNAAGVPGTQNTQQEKTE